MVGEYFVRRSLPRFGSRRTRRSAGGRGLQSDSVDPVHGVSQGEVPPPRVEAARAAGSRRNRQQQPATPAVPEPCEKCAAVDIANTDAVCAAAASRTSSVSSVASTAAASMADPNGTTMCTVAAVAIDGNMSAAGASSDASEPDAASDSDAEGSLRPPPSACQPSAAVPEVLPAGAVVDAGFSLPQCGPQIEHSWSQADARAFRVRSGPNYRRTGAKAPSLPALGTVVAMDCLRTPRKVHHLMQYRRIRLPQPTPGWSEAYPEFFIVNQMLPAHLRHTIFTSEAADGETLNLLAFVRLPPGLGD
eukprot:scaffold6740_cov126-Isochrysis_galbana.AAC.1